MLLLVMFKIKKLKLSLKSIRKFFRRLTDVLIPIVALTLLLGIIFGIDAPFVGNVLGICWKCVGNLLQPDTCTNGYTTDDHTHIHAYTSTYS